MIVSRLKQKLKDGSIVKGLANTCPAPNIIERMCQGWDFVWIDAQHGQYSYDSVLHSIRAAMTIGVDTIVRVPGHEYGVLGPYADTACSCIMVPMVDDRDQAKKVVEGLKFPPIGMRSFGGRRMIDLYGREYHKDNEVLVMAQIETPKAVENLNSIAETEGIDILFFGPDDMKIRMDIDVNAPVIGNKKLLDAMEEVSKAAFRTGKACGCIAADNYTMKLALDMGYRLFMCGSDIGYLRSASSARLEDVEDLLKERESENRSK